MLAGHSMGLDPELKHEMEKRGVIVIDGYVEEVEELYQACDAYLFPVREEDSAMEFPLSVLEAMSCDLAVAAYPYGGLPLAFEARNGLAFAETDEGLIEAVRRGRDARVATRAQAELFGWERVSGLMLEAIGELRDAGAITAAV
jgi:glycosyltransferase involved in cell wall biosynthesis